MELVKALNNPEYRDMIEAIDDIWVSLDYGARSEPTLENILSKMVFKLRALGLEYDPRTK